MKKLFALTLGLLISHQAAAACPEYLDNSMRKLHSKD